MKNKILKILITLVLVVTLTGCTTTLKNDKNEVITNPETGQSLTENILCKPTDKNLAKIYEENKVDIDKLPNCDNFKINDNYEGLWTSIFVKPLAWLILKIGKFVKSYALSIVIITIVIRIALLPLTKKTMMQSEKMNEAKKELDRLEEKYKNRTTTEDQQQKANEMMLIYKKHNINPVGGCLTSFIQLPIFFAFLEAINRIPAIFEQKLFGLSLGTTPYLAISNGNWYILILNVLIIVSTYFSFKLTSASGDNQTQKQTKTMGNIMTIFIGFMSFSLPAAIAIYWLASTCVGIIQNLIVKKMIKNKKK